MKHWIALVALVCCAGCQSATRDGISAERAIRLRAPNHGSGLQAEHDWLKKHLPGFRLVEGGVDASGEEVIYFPHRTEATDRAILSVYTVQLPDGSVRDVYFDQSAYFGREEKEAPNLESSVERRRHRTLDEQDRKK